MNALEYIKHNICARLCIYNGPNPVVSLLSGLLAAGGDFDLAFYLGTFVDRCP